MYGMLLLLLCLLQHVKELLIVMSCLYVQTKSFSAYSARAVIANLNPSQE